MEQSEIIYELRGDRIASLEDFYREIGEDINGPDGYFGRNLDAFNDCLEVRRCVDAVAAPRNLAGSEFHAPVGSANNIGARLRV